MSTNVHAQVVDTLLAAGHYRLHFKILKGKGSPILFESGGGLDVKQWDSIANTLNYRLNATMITYDRAGFGTSTLDTAHYNILAEIESLETSLQNLGYGEADFLLVGHSLGGFYNRVFAARHPVHVKGMVLLDPRIPSYADMEFAKNYFHSINRKDYEAEYLNFYYLLANMERNSDYVRQVPLPNNIPILDIMAEIGPFEDAKENTRFQSDQRNLVKANKNRKLIVARGSSHDIPRDKPGFVIEQIADFYRTQFRK